MTINSNTIGQELTLALVGRLDTTTAPQLEAACKIITGINSLVMDFSQLEYVSSAGLRVILGAQKAMAKQGKMVLTHVNDNIMEVFDVTGFADILTIVKE